MFTEKINTYIQLLTKKYNLYKIKKVFIDDIQIYKESYDGKFYIRIYLNLENSNRFIKKEFIEFTDTNIETNLVPINPYHNDSEKIFCENGFFEIKEINETNFKEYLISMFRYSLFYSNVFTRSNIWLDNYKYIFFEKESDCDMVINNIIKSLRILQSDILEQAKITHIQSSVKIPINY